jgi:hypothetical protein
MKRSLVLIGLLVAGCGEPPVRPAQLYTVTCYAPSGTVVFPNLRRGYQFTISENGTRIYPNGNSPPSHIFAHGVLCEAVREGGGS